MLRESWSRPRVAVGRGRTLFEGRGLDFERGERLEGPLQQKAKAGGVYSQMVGTVRVVGWTIVRRGWMLGWGTGVTLKGCVGA